MLRARLPTAVWLLVLLAQGVPVVGGAPSEVDLLDVSVPVDPGLHGPAAALLPAPPGTARETTLRYGPFVVTPGYNNNRLHVDVWQADGFITYFEPVVIDAETGRPLDGHDIHLHHAHWLRPAREDEPTYGGALAWVFGAGGEATRADIEARSDAEPGGPRYGVHLAAGDPLILLYMIHNFGRETRTLYLDLAIRFVDGDASTLGAQGEEYHALEGRLWGATFDVPRERAGDGLFVYPPDEPLGRLLTIEKAGTVIGTAGHLHENGIEVRVANLGPDGSGCEADLDDDGYAGVTIARSRKVHREPRAFPAGHDFQMETTLPDFRAPVHAGDRLAVFGLYANRAHATYEAMAYAGMYIDFAQPPATTPGRCDATTLGARALHGGDPLLGEPTKPWDEGHGEYCGSAFGATCDKDPTAIPASSEATRVVISDFMFVPGDRSLSGPLGGAPRIPEGGRLAFVSADAGALGVRHAVSSCAWPCDGEVLSNYPRSDGVFDSGWLGNLDPVDGAPREDTVPVWETPTDLAPGFYSYYCRMHPWMRGVFEVAGGDGPGNPPDEEAAPTVGGAAPSDVDTATPSATLVAFLVTLAAVAFARRRV
ncbi:MAG: cupredoxin domain-containing protein [Methanobacteriota archaeon]